MYAYLTGVWASFSLLFLRATNLEPYCCITGALSSASQVVPVDTIVPSSFCPPRVSHYSRTQVSITPLTLGFGEVFSWYSKVKHVLENRYEFNPFNSAHDMHTYCTCNVADKQRSNMEATIKATSRLILILTSTRECWSAFVGCCPTFCCAGHEGRCK